MATGGGFGDGVEQLPIVGFEGPLSGGLAGGAGAGAAASRVEQLFHAPGQAFVVVGIRNHVAFLRRL